MDSFMTLRNCTCGAPPKFFVEFSGKVVHLKCATCGTGVRLLGDDTHPITTDDILRAMRWWNSDPEMFVGLMSTLPRTE